jgi:hypothetical protein
MAVARHACSPVPVETQAPLAIMHGLQALCSWSLLRPLDADAFTGAINLHPDCANAQGTSPVCTHCTHLHSIKQVKHSGLLE